MNRLDQFKTIFYFLFVASIIYAAYFEQYYLIAGTSAATFAVLALFSTDRTDVDYNEKNRTIAMMLSPIPCAGQMYLGDRRHALLFLSVYGMCAFVILMMMQFSENVTFLLVQLFTVIFLGVLQSMMDVETGCNVAEFPFLNPNRELRLRNYRRPIIGIFATAFALTCISAVLDAIFVLDSEPAVDALFVIIWAVCLIFSVWCTKGERYAGRCMD